QRKSRIPGPPESRGRTRQLPPSGGTAHASLGQIPAGLLRNSRLARLSRSAHPGCRLFVAMKHIPLVFAVFLGAAAAAAQPALTVYNQGFAVVRERVPLDLGAGENSITYVGATSQLEPDSVVLRDPEGKVRLRILEQSYRADVMSQ